MTQVIDLITRAAAVTGGDSATARRLGVPPQMVYMWKTGRKPCPPEDQAQLAQIAGVDPVQALIRAHLERHEGTPKGERLFTLLGKRLLQTGGASGSLIAGLALFFMIEVIIHGADAPDSFIRCILC